MYAHAKLKGAHGEFRPRRVNSGSRQRDKSIHRYKDGFVTVQGILALSVMQ